MIVSLFILKIHVLRVIHPWQQNGLEYIGCFVTARLICKPL